MKGTKHTLIILLMLVSNNLILCAQEYFLNTAKYTDDWGETIYRKPTKFTINLNTMILKVTQSGSTIAFDIIDKKIEPDKRESDGISSMTIFECMSSSNEEHLFILHQKEFNDGAVKTSMIDENRNRKTSRLYLK